MNSISHLVEFFSPDNYNLSITLNRTERTFSGIVTIHGTVVSDNHEIRLHAENLSIQSVTLDGKNASFHKDDSDDSHELVINHPDIFIGAHIIVVSYSGTITDDMNGIYPCYYEVDGQKYELLATQFESHFARRAFPCVDEPEAKATFDVTLTTEPDITVLGNMPIQSQTIENNLLVTTFETTPRMSSYLLAWVVGNLQKTSAKTNTGVEVSVWSTPAHNLATLSFALDIAVRTIEFFNDYFDTPYPLPKSDHVALPDFSAGAMENWGLITYREIALLVDPKTTSIGTKQYVATVIAHELSHQWFGNLVTMKWWNDLWLNESFADLMEYVAIDALEPSWNVWLDFATNEVISSLRRDSIDGVQSIQTDVHHPDEISTLFDPSIVYAKGGRILRMLQAYIGTDAMRRGLKEYFKRHAYTNTSADDLWQALTDSSHKDVASFMHAWMTQPGFPVVSISRHQQTVTLAQQQFFIGPHQDKARMWPIPLHGLSNQIPDILESKQASFTYNDESLLFLNHEATSHFITKYDDTSYTQIIQNIDTLSAIDKLQFIHEQLLLAKAELQSHALIIPLLTAFSNETNESVWSIISLAINELKKFVETDTPAEKKLKYIAGNIISSQYMRLGWDQREEESENDTKLRSIIIGIALYAELPDALQEAARRYQNSSIDTLDPELRLAILTSTVRHATDNTVFDTLLDHYKKATSSELRDDIAAAVTSTRQESTIQHIITLLQDTSFIRKQDFTHWFVWMLRNRYARQTMWQWTQTNWKWLEETFKADASYDMLPRYIASALVTKQQLEEYRAFFKPHENDAALSRNIRIGYTELEGIVSLLENDGKAVRNALLNFE